MSSIPGRSDSQRSYTKGNDQISVRRVSEDSYDVEGRKSAAGSSRSETSSSPSGDQGDLSFHDSCVLKHFSKHRSSHLRFLAWVAYTRRFTNDAITDEERRTCPLLWCRTKFADQEAMLQHVWNCPHLSKGLYWCFHCQKHERLGKFHKRCTGIPSKTDRLANVAKKLFSKLGAGSHRSRSQSSASEGSFSIRNSWKSTDVKDPDLFRESPIWDYSTDIQEMPDTSMCPEMAADWSACCQELADTSVMEMVGQELNNQIHNEVDYLSSHENFYTETFDECVASSSVSKARALTPMLPRLDTSMSPLHNGEWKYPIQSFQQDEGSSKRLSLDDIVSPMSAVGPQTPYVSLEVSPTETEASGASFFTDSGYTSATSAGDNSQCPSRVPSTKRTWDCADIPEEHYLVDEVAPVTFPVSIPDFEQAITESLFSTPSVSRSSSITSGKSKAKEFSPHWSDAQTLVQSFSEVLDEHITHTKATLQDIPSTPIMLELLAISKSSMVSIGLEVLAGIFEGRRPSSIIQIFAFTHIACACAIAMRPDGDPVHTKDWFQDSNAWISGLSSIRDRQLYTQVITSVWQPQRSTPQSSPSSLPSPITSSNQLLKSCQHFLDILENFDNLETEAKKRQSPNSGFDFNQLAFEINASSRVIEKLKSVNQIEAFISDVVGVGDRLRSGRIKNIRGLELELICAGKVSSQSQTAYERFLDHVTALCNELYNEELDSPTSRTAHHIRDISLIKKYLPEEIYHGGQVDHFGNLDMSFDDQCFDFVGASVEGQADLDLDLDLDFSLSISSFEQQPQDIPTTETNAFTSQAPRPSNIHAMATPIPIFQFNSPTPPAPPLTFTQTFAPSLSNFSQSTSNSSSPPAPPPTSNPSPTPQDRYRCFCGHIPNGEERWKASNLRRHKRTQHPDLDNGQSKAYKCRWPGCKSVFTRSDNLRSHQRSRGHEDIAGMGGIGCIEGGGSGRGGKKQRLDERAEGFGS